jgi:hypothetical protein
MKQFRFSLVSFESESSCFCDADVLLHFNAGEIQLFCNQNRFRGV